MHLCIYALINYKNIAREKKLEISLSEINNIYNQKNNETDME